MKLKNIFVNKLNISSFSSSFMYKLQPFPEKGHPPLSQQTPSKN